MIDTQTSVSAPPGAADPVPARHRDLERVAMVAMRAGRLLMECGAKATVVRTGITLVAQGLGAEDVHIRVGFASLAVTVSRGSVYSTRMMSVPAHGVNLRLNHELRRVCMRIHDEHPLVEEAERLLDDVVGRTRRHPWPLGALAAGLACAAFSQLLGGDWYAVPPVLLAACVGQAVRVRLVHRGVNAFVVTAVVAALASGVCGLLAGLLGSGTADTAMFAAVLFLVPGVQALNAQTDIMENHPTLGSARAVSVVMLLVFLTVGVWAAQLVLGVTETSAPGASLGLGGMALFGAIAAAGFGVLFNFGWTTLMWAAGAGGVAVTVRTLGLDAGWSLEAASFMAAATVGVAVQALDMVPAQIRRAGNALAVAGCIPMIPGQAAAHAIIGLLALTGPALADPQVVLVQTAQDVLRVVFTIGAIGAGLTIVTSLLRRPEFGAR